MDGVAPAPTVPLYHSLQLIKQVAASGDRPLTGALRKAMCSAYIIPGRDGVMAPIEAFFDPTDELLAELTAACSRLFASSITQPLPGPFLSDADVLGVCQDIGLQSLLSINVFEVSCRAIESLALVQPAQAWHLAQRLVSFLCTAQGHVYEGWRQKYTRYGYSSYRFHQPPFFTASVGCQA
jgi:hypothetical protein